MGADSREPAMTTGELRRRAGDLAESIVAMLESGSGRVSDARAPVPERELAIRRGFFADFRASARALAASPAWRTHDLTTNLLLLIERLRDEIDTDLDGTDAEWRVREVLTRAVGVLNAMVRRLDDEELDDPKSAARFVVQRLAHTDIGRVAALLGVSPLMVHDYREGNVGALSSSPVRVVLVARLTKELLGSMTDRGALLWFDVRMIDGRTPRELIVDDPLGNRQLLMALARGRGPSRQS